MARHLELGELLFSAGERAEALAEFAAAVREDLSVGDTASARATAESILRRHPGVPDLYAVLAQPFVLAGRSDIAAGYFASAATLAASVGDGAARERYLREALTVRPKWAEGLLQLGESCAVSGDRAGAMEAFVRLEALYVEEERYPKAAEVVRRQVTLNPKDASLRERLAELHEKGGDKLQAAETLEELAELRRKGGHFAQAITAYRKLIVLRPRDPATLQRFAEMLEKIGQGPEVVEAYIKLAEAYSARGATVQAAEIYARVLGMDPGHAEARERLMSLQK